MSEDLRPDDLVIAWTEQGWQERKFHALAKEDSKTLTVCNRDLHPDFVVTSVEKRRNFIADPQSCKTCKRRVAQEEN